MQNNNCKLKIDFKLPSPSVIHSLITLGIVGGAGGGFGGGLGPPLPPVDFRAVCLVLAILHLIALLQYLKYYHYQYENIFIVKHGLNCYSDELQLKRPGRFAASW